jgi:hypothetical protein
MRRNVLGVVCIERTQRRLYRRATGEDHERRCDANMGVLTLPVRDRASGSTLLNCFVVT